MENMKKFLNIIAQPIVEYLVYFFFLFVLIGIPEICMGIHHEYVAVGRFNWAIINVAATILMVSYVFTLILYLLPHRIKSAYTFITLLVASFHFIGSIFLIKAHGDVLNADIISIILNSNKAEMREYLSMYLSGTYLLLLVMVFVGILASYYFINKYARSIKFCSGFVGVLLIVSLGLIVRRPLYLGSVFPYKYIKGIRTQNRIPDLSEYTEEIKLISFKDIRPQNIVVIMGESFNKNHSSLYGYNKDTNPLLTKLRADSLLYVYSNVTSSATHTIECFQSIMSTYKTEYGDSIDWYRCTTLFEVLKDAGYKTYWVSNQSKYGINDNIPSKYAELCDTALFVGNKFKGAHRTSYDEDCIPLLESLLTDRAENSFYICHLMGSHFQFTMRYPKSFEKFTVYDYNNFHEYQRKNRATYDNSILYNDMVVYELMNLFVDKEAVVFYFPDHALDVYQSSEDYIGHAKSFDPKSIEAGSDIPFMIFATPRFQEKFPAEMKLIKECTQQSFRTDDMIYTIMDLIGVSFEKECLDGKSLFRK